MSQLPDYIVRDGEMCWTGPYEHSNSLLYTFFMKAKVDKLVQLCNQQLNHPGSQRRYAPLGGLVLINCSRLGESRTQDPAHPIEGSMNEQEVAFLVPVVSSTERGEDKKIRFFAPYLFVDNIAAAVVGREVYGLPKQYATVQVPALNEKAHFEAQGFVMGEDGHGADNRPLVSIDRTDGVTTLEPPQQDWGHQAGEIFDLIRQEVLDYHPDLVLNQSLHVYKAELVALKQFRSPRYLQYPGKACYQAVVEVPLNFNNVKLAGLLPGNFEVKLPAYPTHKLQDTLGLETTPVFATVMQVDLTLDTGQTIWSAGVDGGAETLEAGGR